MDGEGECVYGAQAVLYSHDDEITKELKIVLDEAFLNKEKVNKEKLDYIFDKHNIILYDKLAKAKEFCLDPEVESNKQERVVVARKYLAAMRLGLDSDVSDAMVQIVQEMEMNKKNETECRPGLDSDLDDVVDQFVRGLKQIEES